MGIALAAAMAGSVGCESTDDGPDAFITPLDPPGGPPLQIAPVRTETVFTPPRVPLPTPPIP
jgi:hypothetical protein